MKRYKSTVLSLVFRVGGENKGKEIKIIIHFNRNAQVVVGWSASPSIIMCVNKYI